MRCAAANRHGPTCCAATRRQRKSRQKLVLYRQASGLSRWPISDPAGFYIGGRVAKTPRQGMGRRMKNKFLSAFSRFTRGLRSRPRQKLLRLHDPQRVGVAGPPAIAQGLFRASGTIVARRQKNDHTIAARRKPISDIPTPVSKPRSGAVSNLTPYLRRFVSTKLKIGGFGVGFIRIASNAGRRRCRLQPHRASNVAAGRFGANAIVSGAATGGLKWVPTRGLRRVALNQGRRGASDATMGPAVYWPWWAGDSADPPAIRSKRHPNSPMFEPCRFHDVIRGA